MKKALYVILITFVYILFSFSHVEAASLPLSRIVSQIKSDAIYEGLNSSTSKVTLTSDASGIDFTYVVTVDGAEKTYVASFEYKDLALEYNHPEGLTGDDVVYQHKVANSASRSIFFALGTLDGIAKSYLNDMAKDFSKYTYDKYGFELTTFPHTKTDGTEIKVVKNFKIHTTAMSVAGTSVFPEPVVETPAPAVSKTNDGLLLVILISAVIVVLLLVTCLVIRKAKKAKAVNTKETKKVAKAAKASKTTATKKTTKK